MTDLAITFDGDINTLSFNASVENGDLKNDSGLYQAVLYSLFTDRIAEKDDVISDGTNDRRGHWYDNILGESEGSRLWLLRREKQSQKTLNRAVQYCREALEWLLDDVTVKRVTVTATWQQLGLLAIKVVIDLNDDSKFTDIFNYGINDGL
ncbi:phage GP46 family protein [Pseudomonadota bacterium]|nr:phage GP46 family protein [Pseudomonadota bacterium]